MRKREILAEEKRQLVRKAVNVWGMKLRDAQKKTIGQLQEIEQRKKQEEDAVFAFCGLNAPAVKSEIVLPENNTKEPLAEKPKKAIKNEKVLFLEEKINSGRFTKQQLIEEFLKWYGASKSYVDTLLSDGKNPKYNKFSRLLVVNDDKTISFVEE